MGVSSHHCAKALTKCCCWMTGMSPPHSAAVEETALEQNQCLWPCWSTALLAPAGVCKPPQPSFPRVLVDCAWQRSSWILLSKSLLQSQPTNTSVSLQTTAVLFPVRTESSSISMICFLVWFLWTYFGNEASIMNMSQRFSPRHLVLSHIPPDE